MKNPKKNRADPLTSFAKLFSLNPAEPKVTKRHNVDILLAEGFSKRKDIFPIFTQKDNCIVVEFSCVSY